MHRQIARGDLPEAVVDLGVAVVPHTLRLPRGLGRMAQNPGALLRTAKGSGNSSRMPRESSSVWET